MAGSVTLPGLNPGDADRTQVSVRQLAQRVQELATVTAGTPASSSASGTTGDVVWDSGFLYVCVAANTWKRVALATW
jgi:hypothetical protein